MTGAVKWVSAHWDTIRDAAAALLIVLVAGAILWHGYSFQRECRAIGGVVFKEATGALVCVQGVRVER